jgi:hypothetical protein
VIAVSLLLTIGCGSLWNQLNQSGLEQDVRYLLIQNGFDPVALDCAMIETTRDGFCLIDTPPKGLEGVVDGLRLKHVETSELITAASDRGCRRDAAFSGPNVRLFQSSRRAPELRRPDGGAFEFLVLFEAPGTGAACVQVSYAYG